MTTEKETEIYKLFIKIQNATEKVKKGEKKKSPRSEKTRGKWKKTLRLWLRLILNWRFLVCFGIGWIITNGWSYILFALGWLFQNEWMLGIASAYLAFLWLPISPEKVVTVAIALFLVRKLFPRRIFWQLRERTAPKTKRRRRQANRKNKREKRFKIQCGAGGSWQAFYRNRPDMPRSG